MALPKMKDENKKKSQLIEDLAALRQQVKELQALERKHARAEEALRESEERFRQIYDEPGSECPRCYAPRGKAHD